MMPITQTFPESPNFFAEIRIIIGNYIMSVKLLLVWTADISVLSI